MQQGANVPDDSGPPSTPPGKAKGIPVAFVLGGVLLLAVVAIAALGLLLYQSTSETRRLQQAATEQSNQELRHELEKRQAAEQGQLTIARNRQGDALAFARRAATNLTTLQLQLDRVLIAAAELQTNEAGRAVAVHPDLVAQSRRLYEAVIPSLPAASDLIAKLEAARRIEQQVADALGTTYYPEPDILVTLQNSALWAETESRKVADAQNLLTALVREARIKAPPAAAAPHPPTLAAAMDALAAAEEASKQRAILAQTTVASTNATAMLAEAEARRIIESALIESNKIMTAVLATKAKEDDEARLRQADRKIQEAQATVTAAAKLDDARRIELRNKASTSEVQGKLAPFITPGYWQIGGIKPDLKPLSFSALQAHGALEPTIKGMDRLVEIASRVSDHVRPRWKLERGRNLWHKSPQDMEKVKETQALLVELGPVLVELKMLEP